MGCECGHCEHEEERSKIGTILLLARLAVSLTLALLGKFLWTEESVGVGINVLVMLLAYGIVAYDIFIKAFKNLFLEHEWFDECALMIVASAGAFALRAYGSEHNEFLEAVLIIWLYQVGEFLSDYAADKSREAIVSTIDLREEIALREVDGVTEKTKASELHKGDIVLLQAGGKVYCDGVVVSGSGEVNESSLTGEALPVHKEAGDVVYSGTFLSSGSLRVESTADYEDSTSAKLLHLIEEGAEEKSKATRFITKFAKIYTPVVIGLALLLAVIPPLYLGAGNGENWANWIYVALTFLVISCPCAIVISVPLAYFSGLGLASKNGILIKGASYIDAMNELREIIFDKTGTLTSGEVQVSSIELVHGEYENLLSRAESGSTHPFAKAIAALHPEETLRQGETVEEVAGQGIIATLDGHRLVVGKRSLLQQEGIEALGEDDFFGVHVAVDGAYEGRVVCIDAIKANSKQTIEDLHRFGIKSRVFSGDKKAMVRSVAETLGCDGYVAEMLPEQKQEAYRNIKSQTRGTVAFCGDGINDAPTLSLADIGIAMGKSGADVTLDNADVVIADDDPGRLVKMVRIAKMTRNTALFAIVFSLIFKAVVAALSLVGATVPSFALPLWVAVFADSGLAVAMVFTSLLLYFRKTER